MIGRREVDTSGQLKYHELGSPKVEALPTDEHVRRMAIPTRHPARQLTWKVVSEQVAGLDAGSVSRARCGDEGGRVRAQAGSEGGGVAVDEGGVRGVSGVRAGELSQPGV